MFHCSQLRPPCVEVPSVSQHYYSVYEAQQVTFSAYLFLLHPPLPQSLSEPCFTPHNKSFGQMVAVTKGTDVRSSFVLLGTEAWCCPWQGHGAEHTALHGDHKEHPPLWGHPCAAQGLLCLNYPAVPPRAAPESQNLTKMSSKAKALMKMFSVFSSCVTHSYNFCYKHCPQCFNKSFEWETSS